MARWRAPLGNVLFLCAEDGLADTVRPKIDLCGGDPQRVYVLDGVRDRSGHRMVNLARDIASIEAAIAEAQPELVIIDPITAYLGKTDAYKDAEVRGVISPLLATIAKHRCARCWSPLPPRRPGMGSQHFRPMPPKPRRPQKEDCVLPTEIL